MDRGETVSRSMFDGYEHSPKDTLDISYTSGDGDGNLALVDRMIEYYDEKSKGCEYFEQSTFQKSVIETTQILSRGIDDDFSHNAFLDWLVIRLSTNWTDNVMINDLDVFLNVVVQGLYNLNYNNFQLDITPFSRYEHSEVDDLACDLLGIEEDPLVLKLVGDAWNFGHGNEHCVLELYGDAHSAGGGSENSHYLLHGKAGNLAFTSRFCTYELEQSGHVCAGTVGCTFYAKKGLGSVVDWPFWDENNKLYYPDDKDGWKQITERKDVVPL